MPTLACTHQEVGQPRRACLHLLSNRGADYCKRFTGLGKEYDLICLVCKQQPEQIEANLRNVCQSCFVGIEDEGCLEALLGQPQVLERATGLSFVHETLTLAEPLPAKILDIQPVEALAQSVWVALTEHGALARFDLERRSYTWLAQIPASALHLEQPVGLYISADGSMAAVVNTYGQRGVVVDLATGAVTMSLQRDDDEMEHCPFPLAFFQQDGRLLLVHGTEWSRLDISDPCTGVLLTGRPSPVYKSGEPQPAHYLDYFQCRLSISPSQEWVVNNGWVWHPVGAIDTWNLRHWLKENVWESEDGPSKKTLCWRGYYWDGPLCWMDGKTMAVWGYGEDHEWLLPAVRIFDVVTGKELCWFPGPLVKPKGRYVPTYREEDDFVWRDDSPGSLVYATYLFSFCEEQGMCVWDITTGERLLQEPSFCPSRYHRGAHQFLTLLPDGTFQVSRLIGQG